MIVLMLGRPIPWSSSIYSLVVLEMGQSTASFWAQGALYHGVQQGDGTESRSEDVMRLHSSAAGTSSRLIVQASSHALRNSLKQYQDAFLPEVGAFTVLHYLGIGGQDCSLPADGGNEVGSSER